MNMSLCGGQTQAREGSKISDKRSQGKNREMNQLNLLNLTQKGDAKLHLHRCYRKSPT